MNLAPEFSSFLRSKFSHVLLLGKMTTCFFGEIPDKLLDLVRKLL